MEINAGTWYLRAPRSDDRVDDRPSYAAAGLDGAAGVAVAEAGWTAETSCTWAVCEPTTGRMVAEVALDGVPVPGDVADLRVWELPDGAGALADSLPAVLRFATGGLGVSRVRWSLADAPDGAAALAAACGFTADPDASLVVTGSAVPGD